MNEQTESIKPHVENSNIEPDAKYFETYEIKPSDLEVLGQGIDTVANSKLIEDGVLDDMRFVTYDSRSLYIFTRGQHASNERVHVDEIPSTSKRGYKIFKTSHSGFIGRNREDYRGGYSGLLCEEIETTAVNAKKFPNWAKPYWPDMPSEILDVVQIAPYEPFDKINNGRFGYLSDVIAHETGHIELRRLEDWQEGEDPIETFPSERQKEKFLSVIRQTKVFHQWAIGQIIENITRGTIEEMYPMIIDRETAKRYDQTRFDNENDVFNNMVSHLQDESTHPEYTEWFKNSLKWENTTGRLLVRVLEEQFSDFGERKQFVRSVLERRPQGRKDIV